MILAGGLGTRMQAISGDRPKALIPVAGRPFVHHQLAWLADQGVPSVVFCIGHLGQAIRDVVGDGSAWGLAVTYVDEGDRLRGTAGALRLALEQGSLPPAFMVLYGDSYLPLALVPVLDAFERSGAPALMTVFRNEGRWERSNARVRDGRVVLYDKGHPDPAAGGLEFVDYGLSVLRREVVEGGVAAGATADLADLYHRLSLDGLLAAHEVAERFYEVGSPDGLRDLEDHLAGAGR
ncbi:MAG: NTP transferase domain-containing protein [Acidimicrobiales bacterium]